MALPPPGRGDDLVHRAEVRQAARDRRGGEGVPRGWNYGETSEDFAVSYEVAPAPLAPGTYRQITGNTALANGLIAASELSGLPLFLGAYPITPASSILEELAGRKEFGVSSFRPKTRSRQSALRSARLSAARSRHRLGGPRVVLKAETVGLAIALQAPAPDPRHPAGGAVDGMPTKPEQADLLMVTVRPERRGGSGRRRLGPSQCFEAAIEAVRIALKYRTPVYLLYDAYLANGSEPWLIPDVADLPDISTTFAEAGDEPFQPYLRDPETLARPWAIPGTPGLEHRIGGLEKADVTGDISYDPDNHDLMVRLRAQKVAGIALDIPELELDDPDGDAELLVVGWGSTYGPIVAAVRRARKQGARVAHAHLHYLNPVPAQHGRRVAPLSSCSSPR